MLDFLVCRTSPTSQQHNFCLIALKAGQLLSPATSATARVARQMSPEMINKVFGNLLTFTMAVLILLITQHADELTIARLLKLTTLLIGFPIALYLVVCQLQQTQPTKKIQEATITTTTSSISSPSQKPTIPRVTEAEIVPVKQQSVETRVNSRSVSPTVKRIVPEPHSHHIVNITRPASSQGSKQRSMSQSPRRSNTCITSSSVDDDQNSLVIKKRRTTSLCPAKRISTAIRRRSSESDRSDSVQSLEKAKTTFHFKALLPGYNRRISPGSS